MPTSGPNSVTIVQVQNMPAKSIPLFRGTSKMCQAPKPSVLIDPSSKAGGEIKYRTGPSNFSVQTMQLQLRTVPTHFLSIDYEAGSLRSILWDPFPSFSVSLGFFLITMRRWYIILIVSLSKFLRPGVSCFGYWRMRDRMFAYACDIMRIDYEYGIHLFRTHFIHIGG